MKRFQFRLQRVLDVRVHELERCRVELRAARTNVSEAERLLCDALERAERGASSLRDRAAGGLFRAQLLAGQQHASDLYESVRAGERTLAEASLAEEAVRARLLNARSRLRALELQRDRARAAHDVALRRQEQAELDELGGRVARGAGS